MADTDRERAGARANIVSIGAAALGFAASFFFGFLVLVWIGGALLTAVLLQRKGGGTEATRWTAGMLVGHAVGFAIGIALLPGAALNIAPDLVIALALAIWIAWRPGYFGLVLVIAFEVLGLAGNALTFRTLPLGTPGTAALLAHVLWRGAIIVLAAVAIAQLRRVGRQEPDTTER